MLHIEVMKDTFYYQPAITIQNMPDEIHRAIRVCAAWPSHNIEAETCAIPEAAVRPQNLVKPVRRLLPLAAKSA
ncbi:hypothetical protein [Chloracidobacterium validum]|uniref:hypothetical protein n=1 Tax=Chloracidobacterium validum TaxID=2821543 RepID=UPI001FEAF777|nr:hypothetical protein [Chloracidobacterium validum]